MIFELPKPVLGQNWGFAQEFIDGIDLQRKQRYIKVTIIIGHVQDEKFTGVGAEPIKRWLRDAELEAFLASQEGRRAPRGEWRRRDLLDWIREHGLESKFRVTPVTATVETEVEPESVYKLGFKGKVKKVLNKRII